jgi:hypothetical protein
MCGNASVDNCVRTSADCGNVYAFAVTHLGSLWQRPVVWLLCLWSLTLWLAGVMGVTDDCVPDLVCLVAPYRDHVSAHRGRLRRAPTAR